MRWNGGCEWYGRCLLILSWYWCMMAHDCRCGSSSRRSSPALISAKPKTSLVTKLSWMTPLTNLALWCTYPKDERWLGAKLVVADTRSRSSAVSYLDLHRFDKSSRAQWIVDFSLPHCLTFFVCFYFCIVYVLRVLLHKDIMYKLAELEILEEAIGDGLNCRRERR